MPPPLHLAITDYRDEAHWRWALTDARGKFLADHEVALDVAAAPYRGFCDLPGYLAYHSPTTPVDSLLADLGAWMGEQLFGGLRATLTRQARQPATAVLVTIPPAAQELLTRPFELAHLDAAPMAERGIRFVYQTPSPFPSPVATGEGPGVGVRVLLVFSLPTDANPLNLRRERYALKRLLTEISQTRGVAIEPRVLQYGATRQTLKEALEEGAGWDVIHFSGHGLAGELVLEDEAGEADRITADELAPLLRPARDRLRLLTLSACLSGAGSLADARRQLGLDAAATRQGFAATATTVLPSLAQRLSAELGCAALAMRYPVGDEFAIHLMRKLYELLLEKRQPLPAALQLALTDALAGPRRPAAPPLSRVTPILFGPTAVGLTLIPPRQTPDFEPPVAGLLAFPPEPERFVGRLLPMLRATRALAPASPQAGVLFYGMAGAGKTACALELAYRHERERFTGCVWWKAPDEGRTTNEQADIQSALADFLLAMESQLGIQQAALTAFADDPANFERRTLPRLRGLLAQNAILIVLDNLESLLTASNQWRDPIWGKTIEALLSHTGPSRLVLTSRRLPVALARHPRLLCEPIHALSLGESVLLARELPGLRPLFDAPAGRDVLVRTLDVIQGHPKLLELADGLAARDELQPRLPPSPVATGEGLGVGARAFLTTGETAQGEAGFAATLADWTTGLLATLPPAARLLFQFLCRLEEPDRQTDIVEANWGDFLNRLAATQTFEVSETSEVSRIPDLLNSLIAAGLVESIGNRQSAIRNLRIHPFVAETALATADATALAAADIELGNYWIAVFNYGLETELQGGGPLIVEAGHRAVAYLLRSQRWEEASTLLEHVILRDTTPATLATALPLLRRIARATEGTELGLAVAGILANALSKAGRYAEVEQMQHDLIGKCTARGDYRSASVIAGHLLNLLRRAGRPEEALALAEQKAGLTRAAGLGPWTQLGDETVRLQILNSLGRYTEVLAAAQAARGRLVALPETSGAEETVNPWNVREALLDTGRFAARSLEQWKAALDFNAESLRLKQARGADAVGLARTRFNDYSPLLRLRYTAEARALLEYCRAAFEAAHDVLNLGNVFSALADLEDEEGNPAAAAGFERVALRYSYQAGHPEDCAISHNNLANYLARTGAPAGVVLAHRLAGGILFFQTSSGNLYNLSIPNLARAPLPAAPPSFAAVAAAVEQVEGVRFHDLFGRLPARAPDGDAAIAAVWGMAVEMTANLPE